MVDLRGSGLIVCLVLAAFGCGSETKGADTTPGSGNTATIGLAAGTGPSTTKLLSYWAAIPVTLDKFATVETCPAELPPQAIRLPFLFLTKLCVSPAANPK